MPSPMNGILDDFNRPDEDPLDGGRWIHPLGGTSAALQIIGNKCTGHAIGGSGSEMYWHQQRWRANMEVFCTVSTKPAANDWVFLNLRINNNDTASAFVSAYFMVVYTTLAGAGGHDQWQIVRQDAHPATIAVANHDYAAGDRIWFTAIDNVFTGYHDNGSGFTQVLQATDSTYNNDGFISVQVKENLARIDDFGGGSLPVDPAQIYRLRRP